MKKIIIIACLQVVLIACLVGIIAFENNKPIYKVRRALGAKDYKKVVSLYDELKKNEDKEFAANRLSRVATDYYFDFLDEAATYEDVIVFYDMVMDKALKDSEELINKRNNIEAINESRQIYVKGVELMAEKKYIDAIASFRKVIKLDEKNYENVAYQIEKCGSLYREDAINKADKLIAESDYEHAKEAVEVALNQFPDDAKLLEKMEEIEGYLNIDLDAYWKTKYDFGDMIAKELGVSDYNVYFPVDLIFELNDNNIKIYIDESSIKPALDELTSDPNSMDAIYSVAKNYGINQTEADWLIKIVYGGSYSDFILDNFKADIDDALSDLSFEATCFVDANGIYLWSAGVNDYNYISYEENETGLVLNEYIGDERMLRLLSFPITLTK